MAENILETVDQFAGSVPQSEWRGIVVYHRRHGGREYVRWRVWHRHRTKLCWYPDKRRSFVLPTKDAAALAEAITAAGEGKTIGEMPAWLERIESNRDHRLATMAYLSAAELMNEEKRKRKRAIGK